MPKPTARTVNTKRPNRKSRFETDQLLGNKLMDVLTDPDSAKLSNAEIAASLGISLRGLYRWKYKLRTKRAGEVEELQALKDGELLVLVEDRLGKALGYLDDMALSQANAQQLALITGILLDKRQILLGRPQSIVGYQEVESLDELLPFIQKEMERREGRSTITDAVYEEVDD